MAEWWRTLATLPEVLSWSPTSEDSQLLAPPGSGPITPSSGLHGHLNSYEYILLHIHNLQLKIKCKKNTKQLEYTSSLDKVLISLHKDQFRICLQCENAPYNALHKN